MAEPNQVDPLGTARVESALARVASSLLLLLAAASMVLWVQTLRGSYSELPAYQVLLIRAVPLLVAVGFVTATGLRPHPRANIALAAFACAGGLLVAEGSIALLGVAAAPGAGTGSIYDAVAEARITGDAAVPRVPGNVLVESAARFPGDGDSVELYPIGPAPGHTTVVLCVDGSTTVTYRSDRFGFNNTDSLWNRSDIDLAFVGDSYTAGVCVPREQSMPGLAAERWSTLNMGMSGAGPLRELAVLREYVRSVTPRAVVWVYFEGNDLSDLSGETTRRWLLDYLRSGHRQGLAERRHTVDERYRVWLDSVVAAGPSPLTGRTRPDLRPADVLRLRTVRRLLRVGALLPDRTEVPTELAQALDRARADVESWGGAFLLVYMPDRARYDTWLGRSARGRSEIVAFAEREGVDLLDLDPVFRATGDPRDLWSDSSGHLNARGYRIAAAAIMSTIDSLLVPPTP